jgi:hypothetical protein
VVVLQESVTRLVGKFKECGPRQAQRQAAVQTSTNERFPKKKNGEEILDRPNNKKLASF